MSNYVHDISMVIVNIVSFLLFAFISYFTYFLKNFFSCGKQSGKEKYIEFNTKKLSCAVFFPSKCALLSPV